MRDRILDRLAQLANGLLHCKTQTEKNIYARHAWRLAQHLHHTCPPAEGSL